MDMGLFQYYQLSSVFSCSSAKIIVGLNLKNQLDLAASFLRTFRECPRVHPCAAMRNTCSLVKECSSEGMTLAG